MRSWWGVVGAAMMLAAFLLANCTKRDEGDGTEARREAGALRAANEPADDAPNPADEGTPSGSDESRTSSDESRTFDRPMIGAETVDVPGVVDVLLGLKVDRAARIGRPMDTFSPGDTIIAAVQTHGSPAGSRIVASWVYTEGGLEQLVAEDERVIGNPDSAAVRFDMANRDQWRAGRYELRVSVNGALQETRLLQVRD